jgi:hypothetical protein
MARSEEFDVAKIGFNAKNNGSAIAYPQFHARPIGV